MTSKAGRATQVALGSSCDVAIIPRLISSLGLLTVALLIFGSALLFQAAYSQVFQNTLFDLFQIVVIVVGTWRA